MAGRVRVYVGTSLDGRIAGEGDDLSWLDDPPPRRVTAPPPVGPDTPTTFEQLLADAGVVLFGRRTWDVLAGFGQEVGWPYGDLPVLVATHRPLATDRTGVRTVAGTPVQLVEQAREVADGGDVYADGGALARQLLDAGLVDELTLTVLPTALGRGVPLFEGLAAPLDLDLVRLATLGHGRVQLTYRPHR